MKKFFAIIFCVLFLSSVATPNKANAQIPPKAKAFLVVTGYGTVGGALLGFASMAFGTNSRAIAQGASLGLYAGIIFGTYVLVSHHRAMNPEPRDYDPYTNPPPMNPLPPNGYEPYPPMPTPNEGGGGGFFDSSNRVIELQEKMTLLDTDLYKKGEANLPPLYVNLLTVVF